MPTHFQPFFCCFASTIIPISRKTLYVPWGRVNIRLEVTMVCLNLQRAPAGGSTTNQVYVCQDYTLEIEIQANGSTFCKTRVQEY